MPKRDREKTDTGIVSWRIFSDLYEHQSDFCRKLRLVLRIGHTTKDKEIVLEIIEDFLDQIEKDLEELRRIGFEEWKNAGRFKPGTLPSPERGLTIRRSTDPVQTKEDSSNHEE